MVQMVKKKVPTNRREITLHRHYPRFQFRNVNSELTKQVRPRGKKIKTFAGRPHRRRIPVLLIVHVAEDNVVGRQFPGKGLKRPERRKKGNFGPCISQRSRRCEKTTDTVAAELSVSLVCMRKGKITLDYPIYGNVRTHVRNALLSQTQHQKSRPAFAFYSASTMPDKKERRGGKKRSHPPLAPTLLFPRFLPSRLERGKKTSGVGCGDGGSAECEGRDDGCCTGKRKERRIVKEKGRSEKERRKEDVVFLGQGEKRERERGKEDEKKPKEYVRVVKGTRRDRGEIRTMRL
ncbi:hypothetical protein DBV15_03644 [Temnothorax longispinosus]|uniref:Uncharacterized protein n=1 Tax=Temnothorax longispinosus TaxID=300112 RepID=A0A4S2KFN0_9HYME|nr:hypothetical protein DBV15_03644 [Temnothorax longispinosus]